MRLGPGTAHRNGFDIQPLAGSSLPDVARFLHDLSADRAGGPSGHGPLPEDCLSTQRHLEWLLLQNPVARDAPEHGLCVRSASGVISGLLLSFPGMFLAGDQRFLGLGSGSFFVDPQARALGFYLFRRYLNSRDYGFFFSTTCNASSGALWKTLGACAMPNSDTEYMLPLSLEVMLPAFLTRRTSSALARDIARLLGRYASPLVQRFAWRPADVAIEPCRDWDKLAQLFRRNRSPHWITTDRSAEYLQWRYGRGAHNQPFDLCVFRDRRGNEGWFALGRVVRGRQKQIRGCVLLDAVWPRDTMRFRDILPAILQVARSKADAIFLQPRPGLDYGECSRWIIPCRLEAPKVLAIARKGGAPLAGSALDLVPADGDGAF